MLDATDLLRAIKKAAMEAVEASQLSDFCFGKVIREKPLTILVEQKMKLEKHQLVLCVSVADYKDKKNALKKDENIVLIKQRGGQRYLVVDRVVSA